MQGGGQVVVHTLPSEQPLQSRLDGAIDSSWIMGSVLGSAVGE